MAKYTTGELARLCDVSVRTVQYYDNRGILVPKELSEGGRRLYSEDDLNKMKIICFLRGLDLPIDSIKDLLEAERSEEIISILLSRQEEILRREISEKQEKADKIAETKKLLTKMSSLSAESIKDAAYLIENKKQLRKIHMKLIFMALPMNLIEISTVILWIKTGIWLPFAIGMCLVALMGVAISRYYFSRVLYICPQCHAIFKPSFLGAFTARHTPNTRKLKCNCCGYHGFCIETIADRKMHRPQKSR